MMDFEYNIVMTPEMNHTYNKCCEQLGVDRKEAFRIAVSLLSIYSNMDDNHKLAIVDGIHDVVKLVERKNTTCVMASSK